MLESVIHRGLQHSMPRIATYEVYEEVPLALVNILVADTHVFMNTRSKPDRKARRIRGMQVFMHGKLNSMVTGFFFSAMVARDK